MAIVTPDFADGELDLFASLKGIKVVVDVGARTDIEYLKLKPKIILHAFEPAPEFFESLKEQIGDRKNVFLNNYALGDEKGESRYNRGRQALVGSEERSVTDGEFTVQIDTLDAYCEEKGIKKIDFLKIDTEGYDYKVLLGAKKMIPKCRYIQYEHWNDKEEFHVLLEKDFTMTYYPGRNVLCERRW